MEEYMTVKDRLKQGKKYKKAWEKAYNKFKELTEIKSFHGLQFKDKHMVSLEYVLEFMDECLEVVDEDTD